MVAGILLVLEGQSESGGDSRKTLLITNEKLPIGLSRVVPFCFASTSFTSFVGGLQECSTQVFDSVAISAEALLTMLTLR